MNSSAGVLRDLEAALKEAGFAASIQSAGEARDPRLVAVPLDEDDRGRSRGLVLTLASSVAETMQDEGDLEAGDDLGLGAGGVDFLQCYVALPFTMNPDCAGATAQLVNHINKIVPIMGFNMDVVTRTVYFRYMMIFEGTALNPALVEEVIHTIVFLLSEFGPPLEAVATGRRSLDQTISELG